MEKELIIRSGPEKVEIALLENGRLVEFHQEREETRFKVGEIYLGRVRKIITGLNAAFVDVGYERDGFLHYSDLGPEFKTAREFFRPIVSGNLNDPMKKNIKEYPEIPKKGKIGDVLKSKDIIPVQVEKEPISTKGPRLSANVSIPGRYLILTPFRDFVGVSKRIEDAEDRKRLKILIESLRPPGFGVIVRTASQSKKSSELHTDLDNIVAKWNTMLENIKTGRPKDCILSEMDRSASLVRDMLSDKFTGIITNDEGLARELREYIGTISPEQEKIVQHYSGKTPIFDQYGITRQIKSSFGKSVNFSKGPYLVIEHTEAMHVVDVNSGHRIAMKKDGDQESNATSVNMDAAEEVARQLRLRDIGGIVVIDFIDMKKRENRKAVYDKMKELLKKDKATTTVLPLSKFNVMQITRQRVRPEVQIATQETCPSCGGTGKIQSSLLLIERIEDMIDQLIQIGKPFRIQVHPFIDSYIRKGVPSRRTRWFFKYKKWINVTPNNDFPLTKVVFLDPEGEEIETGDVFSG